MTAMVHQHNPSVLLTTVCRPFGGAGEGDSVGAELFHPQVTRNQGIFSYRQIIRCWAIDYIAHNINAPTVVLHYPSQDEFIQEIEEASFSYIGINFVVATFHKVRPMVALIRKHSPRSKIVLGGYGTVLPDEVLSPFSDFICREEGITFMRRLLGENGDRPIGHPYAPIESPRVYSLPQKTKVAHITGGLGCPNGCDFCCTSHFFKRKYIPFVKSGKELYEVMASMEEQAAKAGDELSGFIFIDEDFFIHTRRAREFLECVRKGKRSFSIMGFGSIRGLSQFTAEEIAEMGFDLIWTAFESSTAGYQKLRGRNPAELLDDLKAVGVAVLSSMIIGFPDQQRDLILEEARQFRALGPCLWQILIYFAFPGTPLFEKVLSEGRYRPEYRKNPDYRTFDGFSMHFTHDHFKPHELEALQQELYRENFRRLGPSLVRIIETWFEGAGKLWSSTNPLLSERAERMLAYVKKAMPGLYPAIVLGPNRKQRSRARRLLRKIERRTGRMTKAERLLGWAAVALAMWTWLAERLDIGQQPKLLRLEHRWKAHTSPEVVWREPCSIGVPMGHTGLIRTDP